MMNKLVYLLSRVTQALAPRVDEWSPSHGGKTESCVVGGNNCRLSLPDRLLWDRSSYPELQGDRWWVVEHR